MVQWKQIQCRCEIRIDEVPIYFAKPPWQRYGPCHLGWNRQEEEKSNLIPHEKMKKNV
jgi:hypothetical protein